MCLRPHCGQRVRIVYLASGFADPNQAIDDLMFLLELLSVVNPWLPYDEDRAWARRVNEAPTGSDNNERLALQEEMIISDQCHHSGRGSLRDGRLAFAAAAGYSR